MQGGSRGAGGDFSSVRDTFSSPDLEMGVMGNLSTLRSTLTPKPARAPVGASPRWGAGTERKAGHRLQAGAPSCFDGGAWRYP